jgi:ribosomal-protein-alanine N-acetyltransferase
VSASRSTRGNGDDRNAVRKAAAGSDPASGRTDDALVFRPMTPSDLPTVVALEAVSQFTPWSERNFRDALGAGNLGLVALQAGVLVAMAVLQMGAGDAELLTMAVLPTLRRRGIGRALLAELVVCATAYGAGAIWLEVRVSNEPAIALYRTAGFVETGRRKGYYRTPSGREDAIMMRLGLDMLRIEPR